MLIWLRLISFVLATVGLIMAFGGGWLIALGGSPYYLIAGLGLTVSGWLIWRGRDLGIWLYAGITAATIIWGVWEVGGHFWLLLPRLAGPVIVLISLFTVRFWNSFDNKVPRAAAATIIIAIIAVVASSIDFQIKGAQNSGHAPAAATPDWADYSGSKGGLHYSPAAQITPENVGGLEVAWTYRTGDLPGKNSSDQAPQMFEATPLQIGDTLYICTPRNIIIALNADTGQEKWRHNPKVDGTGVYTMACRGVSYHHAAGSAASDCPRRLLVATVDGRMIALNADNGRPCKGFGRNGTISLREGLGKVKPGFHFSTSPPMIVGNVAIVGGFVLDNMGTDVPSGVVRAFDVLDGKHLWSWDPGTNNQKSTRDHHGTYTRGSPNVWSLMSADEKLGLVYLPTGNPSPDHFGGQRSPELDRYGSSVVALEAATGKLRWSFKTVHHDLWDYDVPSQPLLIDLPLKGKIIPALVQGTKQGEIFLLDRRTGQPLGPVDEQKAPAGNVPGERYAPTQPVSRALPSLNPPALREADMWGVTPIDQMWCRIQFRRLAYQGRFTPPSLATSLIFPGNNGIMNWGSMAFDKERQILVVPTSYMPMLLRLIPRSEAPKSDQIAIEGRGAISPMLGTPFAVWTERPFASPLGIPCNAPPWGELVGIDLKTREVVWRRSLGSTTDHAPLGIAVPGVFNQGGAIMTGGGLAFIGATIDNYLRAFDVRNGRELWKGRLPAGGQALPMSYVSPKTGKQYVVIAAGGHAFMNTTIGDYVVAYSLPERRP